MEDFFIVDDFVDKEQQDTIENWITGNQSVPWIFRYDTAYDQQHILEGFRRADSNIFPVGNSAFVHPLVDYDKIVSDNYEKYFFNFQSAISTKFNIESPEIRRMRINLTNPIGYKTDKYDVPHFDSFVPGLKILIYYINDVDGDTLIFEEKFNGDYDFSKKTLVTRVQPKKGRAVIFDAKRFHAGSWPSEKTRYIINMNFYS